MKQDKKNRVTVPSSANPITASGQVVITGDGFRFRILRNRISSGQDENVAWLASLLTELPAWQNIGHSIARFGWDQLVQQRPASESSALEEYAADAESAWAKRYDTPQFDIFADELEKLGEAGLVVGFELSPTIRRYLHIRGTRYINFCVHPVRFLRDLTLGATTNCGSLQRHLDAVAVPGQEITAAVRRYRAMLAKKHPAAAVFPPDLPLLVGQTDRDAILIKNGEFTRWADFAEALEVRLADFNELIFVEHPMAKDGWAIPRYLRHRLGKTVLSTNANGYSLIFNRQKPALVLTLSSSLGVESAYAGLPTKFLLSDPRERAQLEDIDQAPMQCLGHAVLCDEFWQSLLTGKLPVSGHSADPFGLGNDFLRDSLGGWSFDQLRSGLREQSSRKLIWAARGLQQERFVHLASTLAGQSVQSDLDMQGISDAARSERIELVLTRPLDINESRSIFLGSANNRSMLVSGFHGQESWGCWSSDHCCTLQLLIGEKLLAAGGWLTLQITLQVHPAILSHCPVVRVSHDGATCGYVFFSPETGNSIEARFQVRSMTMVFELELEISRLMVFDPLTSGDTRTLGLAMTYLHVSARPPEESETETPDDKFSVVIGHETGAGKA